MKKKNKGTSIHLENRLFYFLKYQHYILIGILLILNSCKKQDGYVIISPSQDFKVANIYREYIDSLNKADSSANYLVQSLNWNSLKLINVDSNKRVVFVPINLRKKSNVINGLILIESINNNSITSSYFTQIVNLDISNTRSESTASSYDFTTATGIISDYFTRRKNSFHGSINFYNMHNSFLYSLGYEKGAPKYFKRINKAKKGANGNVKANSSCVNYYLTTYYDDGSSETEFLFTSCDPCRQQSKISSSGESIVANECGTNYSNVGGGGSGDGHGAAADLLNMTSDYGKLVLVFKKRNTDGTTLFVFEDNSSLFMSDVTYTFTLDINNRLIPGSESVSITGFISFTQDRFQKYNTDVSVNRPYDNYVYSSFTLTGNVTTALSNFSTKLNIILTIHLGQSPGSITFGVSSYGFKLPNSNIYLR
jgi:hypothetical protein